MMMLGLNRFSGLYGAFETAEAVPIGKRILHPAKAGC
jgi:hypothetical protein